MFYRRVSNAAVKWENERPTTNAFDPQPNEKGVSLFMQDLLDPDPAVAIAMVLEGHIDYGLVSIDAERLFAQREAWRKDVPEIQQVDLVYDPNERQCGPAHCYLMEPTETQKLQSYIKEVLVEVAIVERRATNLRAGKRA